MFDDEFAGTSLDTTKWTAADYGGSPANGEQQFYSPADVSVSDGALVLTSEQRPLNGAPYASGRVTSDGLFSFTYGRVDFRAKDPVGRGLWPAVWLLGEGCGKGSTTGSCMWPNPGAQEIDMLEQIGSQPTADYMTMHYGTNDTSSAQCARTGPDLSADYHDYSLVWMPGQIVWYVDGVQQCDQMVTAAFNTPMYLVINAAVGGHWPGSPDATTTFPQRMLVKYVRVYQHTGPAPGSAVAIAAGSPMNVGGFAPDADYSGGMPSVSYEDIDTSGVRDPADPGVYQHMRQGPSFTYAITGLLPAQPYTLRLHFAETTYGAAGQRVFNVSVRDGQGARPALTNFDIYAAAGGGNRAVVEEVPIIADAGGQVTVAFTQGSAGQPAVSGLDVVPATLPAQTITAVVPPPLPDPTPYQSVYASRPLAGWASQSTATVDIAANAFVHSGSAAISVDAQPGQAFCLDRDAFDTTPYNTLGFWLDGGPSGGQSLQVQALVDNKPRSAVTLPPLAANTWQFEPISLTALGVAREPRMNGFCIQSIATTAQPTFYVDDIALTGPPESVDPAVPGSTPSPTIPTATTTPSPTIPTATTTPPTTVDVLSPSATTTSTATASHTATASRTSLATATVLLPATTTSTPIPLSTTQVGAPKTPIRTLAPSPTPTPPSSITAETTVPETPRTSTSPVPVISPTEAVESGATSPPSPTATRISPASTTRNTATATVAAATATPVARPQPRLPLHITLASTNTVEGGLIVVVVHVHSVRNATVAVRFQMAGGPLPRVTTATSRHRRPATTSRRLHHAPTSHHTGNHPYDALRPNLTATGVTDHEGRLTVTLRVLSTMTRPTVGLVRVTVSRATESTTSTVRVAIPVTASHRG